MPGQSTSSESSKKDRLTNQTFAALGPSASSGTDMKLLSYVISPVLERRHNEWMHDINNILKKLIQLGFSEDCLSKNDTFVDTLILTGQIALRTSDKEKLKALLCAVHNSALPSSPESAQQHFFLHLIDQFTIWHMRMIGLFYDPIEWARKNNHRFSQVSSATLADILTNAYPELASQRDFFSSIWREICACGLIRPIDLKTPLTHTGLMLKRTTDLGDQFFRFCNLVLPPPDKSLD